MENNSISTRVINALSYFSIFFLPVIFPLVVWVIARASDNPSTVAGNARKAFWTQIFPLLYIIFAILVYSVNAFQDFTIHSGALFGILLTFALLIALLLFVYNVAMGVKMLIGRE